MKALEFFLKASLVDQVTWSQIGKRFEFAEAYHKEMRRLTPLIYSKNA